MVAVAEPTVDDRVPHATRPDPRAPAHRCIDRRASTARVSPEPVNSAPEMTLTSAPAEVARSNVVGMGCTCSGGTASRRSSPHGCGRHRRALMTPTSGQPEGVADHAVLAGTAAGAQRGEPGDGGGGETDLQRLPSQAGQHGCIRGVGVEQFGAEPVDQQHARARDVARQRYSALEAGARPLLKAPTEPRRPGAAYPGQASAGPRTEPAIRRESADVTRIRSCS